MQEELPLPAPGPSDNAGNDARPSTNTDAPPANVADAQQLLSLTTPAFNAPPLETLQERQSQPPALKSPQTAPDALRFPTSPAIPHSPLRRSASRASDFTVDMPLTPKGPISRRSSLNPHAPAQALGLQTTEETHGVRAVDVAQNYFKKDLARHESPSGSASAGTIVIVHDQCYGHRWSRPKTPKSHLALIVERPERILASVLGISAAYVRLGDRHCHGTNGPHPDKELPKQVPFMIRKTAREVDITSEAVTNVHGTAWMAELKDMCVDAGRKLATTGREVVREPSAPGEPKKEEFHEGDLYLCTESLNAFRGALGGVLDAVDAVFQGTSTGNGPSRAFVCIRPPGHHCSDDYPSGFCWINNVHVGIEHAMMHHGLTHAAIIDFDLHHGDGSQAITWAKNKKVQDLPKGTSNKKKTSIGYFSLHDINSFPCEYGEVDKVQAASICIENAHGQSVWNIHLQPWATPEEFWKLYEEKYTVLLEKTRNYLKFHTKRLQNSPNHPAPKAAIFLSAGFDASEWEQEGMQRHKAIVPTDFYARFTRDVVRLAEEEGTGVDGRVISVLEGGYSDRALTSGVLSHLSGLTDGQIRAPRPAEGRMSLDLASQFENMGLQEGTPAQPTVSYDPSWWAEKQLSDLENMINPPPLPKIKKYKSGPPQHFSSPTQSFTAKLTDPTKYQRSVSGNYVAIIPPREPTPPPPDVDWVTATHALSKLLIPSDRQTLSCKATELAEPKVKKEKPPPVLTSVHVDPSGRQLRGRKPVASYRDTASDDESKSKRAESKANADRRKTMAALPTPSEEAPPARPASRRVSIASSGGSGNGVDKDVSRASSAASRRRSVAPVASVPENGQVAVKKARGAAASRVPKNRPPVPRVPSGAATKPGVAKDKENDMDALTTGLKRITLKLPRRPDDEGNEDQKAAASTKASTRKAPVSRAKATKATTTTIKKAIGQPAKASNPPSPVEAPLPKLFGPEANPQVVPEATSDVVSRVDSSPEPPQIESAVSPPLEQPQPVQPLVQPEPAAKLFPHAALSDGSVSTETIDTPTELRGMVISPEQLPRPSFVTCDEPLEKTVSPTRPDTPPPPAPAMLPDFVQHSVQFGRAPTWPQTEGTATAPIQRQDLPVFSSHGFIPFAPSPNTVTAPGTVDDVTKMEKDQDADMLEVTQMAEH